MKASELRIGNWVKPYVNPIFGTGNPYRLKLSDFYDMNSGVLPEESILPIPLTPDILEKAGFKKKKTKWRTYYYKSVLKLDKSLDDFFHVINENYLNVWNVHQLQNLYFALTGEELEIEL